MELWLLCDCCMLHTTPSWAESANFCDAMKSFTIDVLKVLQSTVKKAKLCAMGPLAICYGSATVATSD